MDLNISEALAKYAPLRNEFCPDWKTFVVVGGKLVLLHVENELRRGGNYAAMAAIESLREQLIAICDEEGERIEREAKQETQQ